ncbi:MAG: CinA family nicotinamide mononucleotide deamidase-related protein [Flavobacteriia bacterium]|jgi:nicotinamide-nucleotide amidase|nr:CinA family nicotinamide mononucleotide deamidase-related protein [Cryomorphaceae bacterium]
MKAELISIGDELLIGQTINTNASWLGQLFSANGISVHRVIAISDDKEEIKRTITEAMSNCELVLITGGLGPTKDDITKHTLCELFDTTLEIHVPTLQKIEDFFSKRNRPMLESNIRQAELPIGCTILTNDYGTAAGMWFDRQGSIVISLPGVPYEMKGIVMEQVMPRLRERYALKSIYHQTILTQGLGESFLAERIADWENRVRGRGFGLAYLPSPGMVKLRITSPNGVEDKPEIDVFFEEIRRELPHYVYGVEAQTLSEVVGITCRDKNVSIGTIESLTGGAIAQDIVSQPGASEYFKGSIVAYDPEVKISLVDVDAEAIEVNGLVSEEIARQMAEHGRKKLNVDFCVSTTGVAGPDGGTDEIPVGTVWVAIAGPSRTFVQHFRFGDDRERNIKMTVLTTLNLLRCEILEIHHEKK